MTLSTEQITGIWTDAWREALEEQRSKTTVPDSQWRTAGRATKVKPRGEDLDFWQYEGLSASLEYAKWLERTGWPIAELNGQPLVEFGVSGEFGGVLVKGYVDVVFNPGDLIVVDYKTGSRTPAGVQQLALYSVMLQDLGLPAPKLGAFYSTRKHELGPVESLEWWDRPWWEKQFARLAAAKEHEIYLANISDSCRGCGVNRFCYAAGGFEAHLYDPDHPEYSFNNNKA